MEFILVVALGLVGCSMEGTTLPIHFTTGSHGNFRPYIRSSGLCSIYTINGLHYSHITVFHHRVCNKPVGKAQNIIADPQLYGF